MPPTSAARYSPEALLAMVDEPLRSVARRLGVDAAVLCRPLTTNQADRFAIKLGLHPGLVWGPDWWRPGKSGQLDTSGSREKSQASAMAASDSR